MKVEIILYFEEFEIDVEKDETILQALLRQGYDPPFSCQLGACATCKAKLISGKVEMNEDEALTGEEIDNKYILTCQSHPLTDDCVVDYDIE
ncbi:2Fe-2S iron-sulfur cluster-binding protein [Bacteroidota bacterium]